jgi:hypothetical protein
MFRQVVRVDEQVVKIYDEEFVEEVSEGVIHVVLKGPRGVAESKGHDGIFV